jgi:hypothetical protein
VIGVEKMPDREEHALAAPHAPERPPPAFPAAPPPEPTGDERVDAALDRLGGLAAAPVTAHVEVFEEVHRRLQDVLASVDEEPAG